MNDELDRLRIRVYLTAIETDVQRSLLFHLAEQLHPDDHKKIKASYIELYRQRAKTFLDQCAVEYPELAAQSFLDLSDDLRELSNLYDLNDV